MESLTLIWSFWTLSEKHAGVASENSRQLPTTPAQKLLLYGYAIFQMEIIDLHSLLFCLETSHVILLHIDMNPCKYGILKTKNSADQKGYKGIIHPKNETLLSRRLFSFVEQRKICSSNCGLWALVKCKSAAPSTLRVKKSISGNTKWIPVTPDDILRFYDSCMTPALNEAATWRF